MKSEIIYRNESSWFGRWGEDEGHEIVISADFSNPANWPYTAKRREFEDGEDTECKVYKLSKALYEKVKATIAANKELAGCEEHVENGGRDLSDDSYFFACDSFSKQIYGASIYSVGSHEAEGPAKDRTANYYVYKTVKEITEVLNAGGVDIWS